MTKATIIQRYHQNCTVEIESDQSCHGCAGKEAGCHSYLLRPQSKPKHLDIALDANTTLESNQLNLSLKSRTRWLCCLAYGLPIFCMLLLLSFDSVISFDFLGVVGDNSDLSQILLAMLGLTMGSGLTYLILKRYQTIEDFVHITPTIPIQDGETINDV